MSGDTMFVRKEDSEIAQSFKGPARLLKSGGYKQFVRGFTSERPEEYEDGSKVQEQAGVVLPVADRKGMVHNNPNPYGRVVVGDVIGGDDQPKGPLNIQVLEDRVKERRDRMGTKVVESAEKTMDLPDNMAELQELLPSLKGVELEQAVQRLQELLAAEQLSEEDQADARARTLGDELDNLLDADDEEQAPAPVPKETTNEFISQDAMPPEQRQEVSMDQNAFQKDAVERGAPEIRETPEVSKVAEEPAGKNPTNLFEEKVQVRFSGKFGRSTIKFLAVEKHDNQVVLIYDPDDNIFIPASDGEPFNLNYNDQTFPVQNVGIEFNLDFLGVSVLVLVTVGE